MRPRLIQDQPSQSQLKFQMPSRGLAGLSRMKSKQLADSISSPLAVVAMSVKRVSAS